MDEKPELRAPWLIAVWPGMGHVALNAGYYLLAKLDMTVLAEYQAHDLFDIDHIEVKDGIIQPGRRPRNRFFLWKDPAERHDLVVFFGEAQPPIGKYPFCRQLMAYAQELKIERVFTFAAMATRMHPEHSSRVFAAATDEDMLTELKNLDAEPLEEGNIGGLNGVLLGVAIESGIRGGCLLGEMPHIFNQLPFPKASLVILEAFSRLAGIELDFSELAEQSRAMEEQLGKLLGHVEQSFGGEEPTEEESYPTPAASEEETISDADRKRIETMFRQVADDRSKAFELKRELDRLGVFREYEDRFLDLFKKGE